MIRIIAGVIGAALLITGCEPTSPPPPPSTQTSSSATGPTQLQPTTVATSADLVQPVRISAVVDGSPLDLAGTVTSCARADASMIQIDASGPLGGGGSSQAVHLQIRGATAWASVIFDDREMDSAPTTPLAVTQNGSDYTASGVIHQVSQSGRDAVEHPVTVTASCAPSEPVRAGRFAQPVAVAASIDGKPVDLSDTIPYCNRDGANSYFYIVAAQSPALAGAHPSLHVSINRATLAVSSGAVEGPRRSREFRGDGPSGGESWRMKVVKEGSVYRVTGVEQMSGGSIEIVADCAGV